MSAPLHGLRCARLHVITLQPFLPSPHSHTHHQHPRPRTQAKGSAPGQQRRGGGERGQQAGDWAGSGSPDSKAVINLNSQLHRCLGNKQFEDAIMLYERFLEQGRQRGKQLGLKEGELPPDRRPNRQAIYDYVYALSK